MSSEQRWMINDTLGLLLQLSRACCLAPVHFVKIRTNNFIYISRPLLFLSVIITSVIDLSTIYILYLAICSTVSGYYKEILIGAFNECVVIVFVSYAVLHSESRIKNYMTCLIKLERAIRGLQITKEINIKKWHIWITFIIFTGGTNLVLFFHYLINYGVINWLAYILMLQFTMSFIIQQLFLYFALYVNFILKIIIEQLQEELTIIMNDKDGKQLAYVTTFRINIPLQSINKAIDMIGMTDTLFPDVLTREKQRIAQRICQINDSHLLACEVMQELNSSDGFLLFLLLIYFSFGIVFNSYGIIKLFHQDGTLLSAKMIVQGLQLLLLAIEIIMIVEPCNMAQEGILKIRSLVCEIMCHVTSTSDPIFKVINGFFYQLVLNDISYTALGICKIGRPLVTSIIAVATTILNTILEI